MPTKRTCKQEDCYPKNEPRYVYISQWCNGDGIPSGIAAVATSVEVAFSESTKQAISANLRTISVNQMQEFYVRTDTDYELYPGQDAWNLRVTVGYVTLGIGDDSEPHLEVFRITRHIVHEYM